MSEFLEATSADDIGEREYTSRNRKDQNIGYREGNFEGRSDALQPAFDASYRLYATLSLVRIILTATVKSLDGDKKGHLEDLLNLMNQELSDVKIMQEYEIQLTSLLKSFLDSLHSPKKDDILVLPEVVRNKFPALTELLDLLIQEHQQ